MDLLKPMVTLMDLSKQMGFLMLMGFLIPRGFWIMTGLPRLID